MKKMNIDQLFLLKFFREHILKLDRKQFAKKCNINPSTITRWEKLNRSPLPETIKKICKTFNLPNNAFSLTDKSINDIILLFIEKNKKLTKDEKIDFLHNLIKIETNHNNRKYFLELAMRLCDEQYDNKHLKTIEIRCELLLYYSPQRRIEELKTIINTYIELNLNRQISFTYYNISLAYFEIENYNECLTYLDKSLNLVRKDEFNIYIKILLLKGQTLYRIKKFKEANDILDNAINILNQLKIIDIQYIQTLSLKAICYFYTKQFKEALNTCKQALKHISKFSENQHNIKIKLSLLKTLKNTSKTLNIPFDQYEIEYNEANEKIKSIPNNPI